MADKNRKIAEAITIILNAKINNGSFGVSDHGAAGQPRRETGLLDERDVERALANYVRPECQRAAAQALAMDHVVVLTGRRGSGKRAGAISLLKDLTREPLRTLSPVMTVHELAGYEYKAGHKYVVVDHIDTATEPDTDFAWNRVRDEVRKAGAFLVVSRAAPVEVDVVTTVRWKPPPAEAILRAHLPDDDNAVHKLLRVLPDDCAMARIAAVAAEVAAGKPVEEAVDNLDIDAADVVRAWFDGRTRAEIIDVTALAFAMDLPARDFEARRAALDAEVRTRLPGEGPPAAGGPTPTAAADSLTVVDPATETRRFARPVYHGLVLAELSARCADLYWDAVRAWLHTIVGETDSPIARGLAKLATADLTRVEQTYLEPWSAGELGWRGQTTAALVVAMMCFDAALVPVALRIVRGWAQHGSATQRHTAALALSTEIGVRYPDDSVKEIWRLLERSSASDEDTYIEAIANLFAVLEREGDDAAVVLTLLERLIREAATIPLSSRARDLAVRSVMAVLAVRDLSDEADLAMRTFIRDRPDEKDLAISMWDIVLDNPEQLRAAFDSMLGAIQGLDGHELGDIREKLQTMQTRRTEQTVRTPQTGSHYPANGPDPDLDAKTSQYPIVDRRLLKSSPLRRLRGFLKRFRAVELPVPAAHEALVYETGDDYVLDSTGSLTHTDTTVARAKRVNVIDMTEAKSVTVPVTIGSMDATPFLVNVRFVCSVHDPVRVVMDGIDDVTRPLHGHLASHHRLFDLGLAHPRSEADHVRLSVSAQVRALFAVRPPALPGLRVDVVGVDVA
ncbi:hypothetical protein EV193_101683 [Herbihabitans rhizosphaerae]|uniref:Uncharacterized protein n=1 Tax=Herbihabitans rhizosphaerae TaxID=1872711 RepID=A0A4Q7L679_9PSEU|nr:hypothetical protein [Herbihabitans rhizosphaerae]RZS44804.1 hypothetical protein EV193_101683 [Herbihabitans rhizosphaerae]